MLWLAEIVDGGTAATATADTAAEHVEGEEEDGPGGAEPAAEERGRELTNDKVVKI